MEENFSMEDFEAALSQSFQKINNGDILKGKIIGKDDQGLLVDVSSYMDGVISQEDLLYDGESYEEYQVGDEITAMVWFVDTQEGQIHLSKKQADKLVIWEDLAKLAEEETPIEVKVKKVVNGGLRIVYKTVEGFMPASQTSLQRVENLEEYVGKTLAVKIIETDEAKKNLIVSRRALEQKEAEEARQSLYTTLKPGDSLTGKVVRLTKFGAFVEIAPHVDGLIHVNDMSWKRVKDPADVVGVGDLVKVTVQSVDPVRGRIGLSLKDASVDPWKNIPFSQGEIVTGAVVKTIDSGAFVEIAPGLEGFVHVSRMSDKRVKSPEDAVSMGQEVTVKILGIDAVQHRISLSMKDAATENQAAEEAADYRSYQADTQEASTNLGDLLGQLKN